MIFGLHAMSRTIYVVGGSKHGEVKAEQTVEWSLTFRADTPEATFAKRSIPQSRLTTASRLQIAASWSCSLLLIHGTVTMFGIQARCHHGGWAWHRKQSSNVLRSQLDVEVARGGCGEVSHVLVPTRPRIEFEPE